MNRLRKMAAPGLEDQINEAPENPQQPDQLDDYSKTDTEFDVPGAEEEGPSVVDAAQVVEDARLAIESVVESYHQMFETLNKMSSKYKGLYDELKMVVKFPNEKDAEKIGVMRDHFNDVAEHYKDEHYLAGIIGVEKEEVKPI